MRRLGRILLGVVGLVGGLALLLVLSIPFDALIGGGRVAALTNTTIANPAGPPVRAFVARPAGPGPHPAVIMIHEWWGLRAEIVGKAEALAAEGYVVVAPDTFRGSSTGWIPRAIYQVSTTPVERVNTDLDAVFAWLAAQPDVQPTRIGIMGFCYGGRAALLYSLHNSAIAATGIFYGMATTDPNRLQELPAPVLGIFGGADASIPLEEVRALEAGLAQAGIPHTISIYPDQPHAFVGDIEQIRQGGPQQEAWNELLAFLRATLQEGTGQTGSPARHPAPAGASPAATFFGALHHRFVCGLEERT